MILCNYNASVSPFDKINGQIMNVLFTLLLLAYNLTYLNKNIKYIS